MLSSILEMMALGSTEMEGRSSSAMRVNVAIFAELFYKNKLNSVFFLQSREEREVTNLSMPDPLPSPY